MNIADKIIELENLLKKYESVFKSNKEFEKDYFDFYKKMLKEFSKEMNKRNDRWLENRAKELRGR